MRVHVYIVIKAQYMYIYIYIYIYLHIIIYIYIHILHMCTHTQRDSYCLGSYCHSFWWKKNNVARRAAFLIGDLAKLPLALRWFGYAQCSRAVTFPPTNMEPDFREVWKTIFLVKRDPLSGSR